MARFVLKLLPDLLELGIDHLAGDREVMARRQRVEQLALHLRTRQARRFLLQLRLEQFLQLVETLEAQRLGELVVDLGLARDLHRLHGDVELGFLAGEVLGGIILGEGDRDGLFLARLRAGQLLLEPGDEAARADFQRSVLGLAAFEFLAVELADEIDDQLVAFTRLVGLLGIDKALLALGELGNRLVHGLVADGNDQALQLQAIGVRRVDRGQDFQLDRDFGVLAFLVILTQRHGGLHRGAQLVLGHHLVDAFADGLVQHVGVDRLAMHLPDQVGGHLAGAKAGHADLRGDLLDLGADLVGNLAGGDLDGICAGKPVVLGFGNLHDVSFRRRCVAFSGSRTDCKGPRSMRGVPGAGEGTRTPTSCDTRT